MAKQEVNSMQIQMAAAAGVKLLAVDDLPVPMSIAKSGALTILEGFLSALAQGELVLAEAPQPEAVGGPGAIPVGRPAHLPPAPEGDEGDADEDSVEGAAA